MRADAAAALLQQYDELMRWDNDSLWKASIARWWTASSTMTGRGSDQRGAPFGAAVRPRMEGRRPKRRRRRSFGICRGERDH